MSYCFPNLMFVPAFRPMSRMPPPPPSRPPLPKPFLSPPTSSQVHFSTSYVYRSPFTRFTSHGPPDLEFEPLMGEWRREEKGGGGGGMWISIKMCMNKESSKSDGGQPVLPRTLYHMNLSFSSLPPIHPQTRPITINPLLSPTTRPLFLVRRKCSSRASVMNQGLYGCRA